MPEEDHVNQWRHNRAFISLIPPEFPDWAVTVTFYTALHAVDALMEHDNVARIVDHGSRNDTLARTNRYSKIWELYHPLFDLSQTVRYMARPQKWIPWPKIEADVLKRYLYPLENSVFRLLGKTEQPQQIKLFGASMPKDSS